MEIQEFLTKLIIKGNIWGILFTRIKRVPDPSIFLASVSYDEYGNLIFKYNEDKVELMDEKNFLKLMEHEGIHVLNRHLQRGIELSNMDLISDEEFTKKYFKELWQVSCDCADNDLINLESINVGKEKIPGMIPEKYDLPKKQIAEYYYDVLKKRVKKDLEDKKKEKKDTKGSNDKSDEKGESKSTDEKSDNGKGEKSETTNQPGPGKPGETGVLGDLSKSIDDHTDWENTTGQQDENLIRKLDANTKRVVTDVLKQLRTTERGNLPGHIQEMLDMILKEPEFPYYKMLQKYVRATKVAKYKTNYAKINRKRIYMFQDDDSILMCPFPGRSRNFSFKVLIIIDTSMSMVIGDILEALGSCKNIIMSDRFCEITVIEIDTVIQKEYKIKRLTDIDMSIKGRGGTHLKDAFVRSVEIESDVTLVFTDGYTEDIKAHPKTIMPKKIIYVIPKSGSDAQILGTGIIVRRND